LLSIEEVQQSEYYKKDEEYIAFFKFPALCHFVLFCFEFLSFIETQDFAERLLSVKTAFLYDKGSTVVESSQTNVKEVEDKGGFEQELLDGKEGCINSEGF